MKKLLSILLVMTILTGLGITASAAGNESEDHVHEILASGAGVQTVYTDDLSGSDFWMSTTYGFVQLKDDGSFIYKADSENEAVQEAFENDEYLFDRFIITLDSNNGGWFGRNVNIGIAPASVKIPKLEVMFPLTDLDGTVEGSILWPDEVCQDIALRTEYGRLAVTEDGYVYTHYPWLDVARNLLKDVVDEQTVTILSGDTRTDVVLRVIGVDDKPVLKDITLNLAPSVSSCGGSVLAGATLGDGFAEQHKFAWGSDIEYGKYGTLYANADGSFSYTLNEGARHYSTTLTETFSCTYKDVDGDVDTGILTINILPDPSLNSSAPPASDILSLPNT